MPTHKLTSNNGETVMGTAKVAHQSGNAFNSGNIVAGYNDIKAYRMGKH